MKYKKSLYIIFIITLLTLFSLKLTLFKLNEDVNDLRVDFVNFSYLITDTIGQEIHFNQPLNRYFRLHESLLNVSSFKKRIVFNGNENGLLEGKIFVFILMFDVEGAEGRN